MFKRLFAARRSRRHVAVSLYDAAVAQARQSAFYAALQVPDSVDGRFDLLALHVYLILRRLKGQGRRARAVAEAVTECLVADMDASLREMGVGDMSIGRRVVGMIGGFYGRVSAYDKALTETVTENDDPRLKAALDRNLYGTVLEVQEDVLAAMAGYIRATEQALAAQSLESLLAGTVTFLLPPVAPVCCP